jgi:hypothetical protein
MAYRAASDASRTLREPSTTTITIITHSRQRSQTSESPDYTQNLPPSKKDTTSLKHAESARIAIVTRHPTEQPTRKTINDNGKQVKSVRVACEEHTRIGSLVSGRDTVSKRLKI